MPLEERDIARLRDMVVWSRKAIAMLGKSGYNEAAADEMKMLALVRCIEVIGEAGNDVSPGTQAALSTVPWHAMYGMRNRLIHDYGNTNYRVVFQVVTENLHDLASIVAHFLADQGQPL